LYDYNIKICPHIAASITIGLRAVCRYLNKIKQTLIWELHVAHPLKLVLFDRISKGTFGSPSQNQIAYS
jgi:hypothetical protein